MIFDAFSLLKYLKRQEKVLPLHVDSEKCKAKNEE